MKELRFALGQIAPILLSYVFIGLASGVLLRQAGYSPLLAFLSALLIYAGSMQIVMVSLLTGGASLPVVALTTLFVNARHLFYGVGFVEKFRKMGRLRPYMALTLTDETFSVLSSLRCPAELNEQKVDFLIQAGCHLVWVLSCTLGALAGDLLGGRLQGLDFSATVFFAVMAAQQWRSASSHLPALTGLLSAALFYFLLGPERFLLPALSLSLVALLLVRERARAKEAKHV